MSIQRNLFSLPRCCGWIFLPDSHAERFLSCVCQSELGMNLAVWYNAALNLSDSCSFTVHSPGDKEPFLKGSWMLIGRAVILNVYIFIFFKTDLIILGL